MGKVFCGICSKRCKGDVLRVNDKFIHKTCFLCSCCKIGLEKGGFFFKDDKYYCKNDYLEKFGVKCNVCGLIAEGEVIIIFGTTFHLNCFKCTICQFIFQRGDKVTLSNNEYLCPHCILRQTSNGTVKKESSIERLTIGEAENILDRETMTASMISTVLSDSSEPTSPDKRAYGEESDQGSFPTTPKIEVSDWANTSFDDNRSSDSECLSIRTEPDTHQFNGFYKKQGYKNFGGSSICIKPSNNSKSLFGRFYNVSYLKIEQQMKEKIHPKALYKQGRSSINTSQSNIHHFHKIDNFSYRSSPNISINKDVYKRPNLSNFLNSSEMKAKDSNLMKMPDLINLKMPVSSMIDIRSEMTMTLGGSKREMMRRVDHVGNLDPISSSRVPNANYEPISKPRFEHYTFTSPSRNAINLHHKELKKEDKLINHIKKEIKENSTAKSRENYFASFKAPQIRGPGVANLITRSQIIQRDSSESDYISVQSFLKTSRFQLSNNRTTKTYCYDLLKISNFSLPRGVDRARLEVHLSDDEFHRIFKLCRDAFYRLPEWKQSDLKKRVDLF